MKINHAIEYGRIEKLKLKLVEKICLKSCTGINWKFDKIENPSKMKIKQNWEIDKIEKSGLNFSFNKIENIQNRKSNQMGKIER